MTLTTHPTPGPGSYAPLRVTRNTEAFQSWWPTLTDTADIADAIDALRAPHSPDVESTLHWLMVTVFHGSEPVPWLKVHGLRATSHTSHVLLDADIARDNDGDCTGVDIVLSLHVTAADGTVVATTPSAYVQWPATVFTPTSTHPSDALAEVIDTALELVNTTIAAADRFGTLARTPRHVTTPAAVTQDDSDEPESEPEIETCRDCGRVTRIDDEPVDTDAADGWDGYCGSCADRREGRDTPDE
jgi:hypothetical protein